MIEGTTLSEGRGTTRPLELLGAPDMDARATLAWLARFAPRWLKGCALRECWFEPTFHKHMGQLCNGIQMHVDAHDYGHENYRPWRLVAALLKAQRQLQPRATLWREFAYEYEHQRLAFDVINGGPRLRQWIEDPQATAADLDAMAAPDEAAWRSARAGVLIYGE